MQVCWRWALISVWTYKKWWLLEIWVFFSGCRGQCGHWPGDVCKSFHRSGIELGPSAAWGHSSAAPREGQRLFYLYHRLLLAKLFRLIHPHALPAKGAHPGHVTGDHPRISELHLAQQSLCKCLKTKLFIQIPENLVWFLFCFVLFFLHFFVGKIFSK